MLSDQITLAVDVLNDGVTENHVFNKMEVFLNRSIYIEDNHQPELRDTLHFYRTFPKVVGNFRGTRKTSFKISKDVLVSGVDGTSNLTVPVIAEVGFSIPIGVDEASRKIIRQRLIALLDDDSLMEKLTNVQMV